MGSVWREHSIMSIKDWHHQSPGEWKLSTGAWTLGDYNT